MDLTLTEAFLKYFGTPAVFAKAAFIALLGLSCLRNKPAVQKFFAFLDSSKYTVLFALLLTGVGLRIAWVLYSPQAAPSAHSEDLIILRHAMDLAEGRGYVSAEGVPTAIRPVGYPFFLSLLYRLWGGERMLWMELLQAVMSGFTLFFVFRIGNQLQGPAMGLLGTALLAFSPTSIFAAKIILGEHLYLPLFLGGISFLISDLKNPRYLTLVTAAFLLGISAHVRTYSFALGAVVFIVWIMVKGNFRQAITRAFLFQVIVLLLALPWALRNSKALGSPVLYTTSIGTALYFGNNPNPDQVNFPIEKGGDADYLQAQTEVERNQAGKRAAFRWIQENPGKFLNRVLVRIAYVLGINREQWVVTDNFHTLAPGRVPPSDAFKNRLAQLDQSYYAVIFMLAAAGLAIFIVNYIKKREAAGLWWIVMILCYYLSIIGVTLGHRKYRYPVETLFCLLAAFALNKLWNAASGAKKND